MTLSLMPLMNPAQCRAARGLLGWTQSDLAREAGISKTSVVQFETAMTDSRSETLRGMIQAFMRYGVEFMPPSGVNRRPTDCRIFASLTAITHDWPAFLQGLVQDGHRNLTILNWPDFVMEFEGLTGIDATVTYPTDRPHDRAVLIGPWMILPIPDSAYRIAVYQPDDMATAGEAD